MLFALRFRTRVAACAMLLAFAIFGGLDASASAQDWPNWRGPSFNGAASPSAKGLPVTFSPTSGVKWSIDLPGPSASTPVVYGSNVFLSTADMKAQTLLAQCYDKQTGKLKWSERVGTGYRAGGVGDDLRKDERSNYSSPSPSCDGKRVVFFYGNGDLAAFDLAGKKLWQRNLQKDYGDFAFGWTFSSSPLLYEGRLYMQILQNDRPSRGNGSTNPQSFLLCMDPQTGKESWRAMRPTTAVQESREAFTTPIPHVSNGRKEILIAGGDFLTGHDPATGRELWRWGTWNENHREPYWRLVPSPVAGDGMVVVCAPKRAPVYATKLGGTGTLGMDNVAWKSEDRSDVTSDVPTPLFYNGRFYVLSDLRRTLTCVEPKTGKVVWSLPIPNRKNCWGSPTGADGKIYFMSLSGTVFVVDAATGKLLSENALGEEGMDARSSVAVAGQNLFVRTDTKLFCIGK